MWGSYPGHTRGNCECLGRENRVYFATHFYGVVRKEPALGNGRCEKIGCSGGL